MHLRDWLRQSRVKFVSDLHPDDVIDQITGPGLLTLDEEAQIDSQPTREAKVRQLIRLLLQRDSERLFAAFRSALRSDYDWLAGPEEFHFAGGRQPMGVAGETIDFSSGAQLALPPLAASAEGAHPNLCPAEAEGAHPNLCPEHGVTRDHLQLVAANALAIDRWRFIARDLGVTDDDIYAVGAMFAGDVKGQCYEMLSRWISDYEGASLGVLIGVLRKNRLVRLANKLATFA